MKIEVKNNNETKVKLGSIVAMKKLATSKTEYYLVISNYHFCYLANIENGQILKKCYTSLGALGNFINESGGKAYSGDKAKLILKGDA